jgi:hypothetical protein
MSMSMSVVVCGRECECECGGTGRLRRSPGTENRKRITDTLLKGPEGPERINGPKESEPTHTRYNGSCHLRLGKRAKSRSLEQRTNPFSIASAAR